LASFFFGALCANAQTENSKSEIEQIRETLMDYIEGTANGEPDRLKRAFHPNFNLYTVIAKAEIVIPNWRIFTDYFLLLKYEGSWKIIHKSYTWRVYPTKE